MKLWHLSISRVGMLLKILVITLLNLVFVIGGAYAKSFGLFDIKSYAKNNSPLLQMKKEDVSIQRGEKSVVQSILLPTVSANGGYTRYKLEHGSIEGVFGESQKPSNERLAWDVEFNYVAFAFGRDYFNYQGATYLVKSSEMDFERAWQNLSFQLSKLYYSILTVRKTIIATKKTIESLKKLEFETSEKVKVGRLPEVDLLKIEVSLSKSIDDLSRLETLEEELLGELKRLMGYNEASELELKNKPIEEIKRKDFDVEKLMRQAIANRSDLRSIEYNIKTVEYNIKSVKASFFPEVRVKGVYTEQSPGSTDFVSDGGAAVMVSVPIFDGFLRKGQLHRLQAKKRRLISSLLDKKLEIKKDVTTAVKDYNETIIRIESAKRSVDHAKEVLRVEKLKYNLGRSTINFVLDAEGALLSARSLFYKAYYDNYIAEENIKLATGTLK